jgi:hypothetical protein
MVPVEANTLPGKVNETVPPGAPLPLDEIVQSHFHVLSIVSPSPNPVKGSPDPFLNIFPLQERLVQVKELGSPAQTGMRMSTQFVESAFESILVILYLNSLWKTGLFGSPVSWIIGKSPMSGTVSTL